LINFKNCFQEIKELSRDISYIPYTYTSSEESNNLFAIIIVKTHIWYQWILISYFIKLRFSCWWLPSSNLTEKPKTYLFTERFSLFSSISFFLLINLCSMILKQITSNKNNGKNSQLDLDFFSVISVVGQIENWHYLENINY